MEALRERPKVGVACWVGNLTDGYLVGTRAGSHGAGKVSVPGGHVEHGETLIDAACRELTEETGLLTHRDLCAVMGCVSGVIPVGKDGEITELRHYYTFYVRVSKFTGTVMQVDEKFLHPRFEPIEELMHLFYREELFQPLAQFIGAAGVIGEGNLAAGNKFIFDLDGTFSG